MNFSAAWQSRLPTRSHVYSTPATWRVWRSAGSFQLLCHGEEPGDGIPVSCSTGLLQGPIQQWRKFRASYAVGKIDVEFAAGDPQFLGIGFNPEKSSRVSGPGSVARKVTRSLLGSRSRRAANGFLF